MEKRFKMNLNHVLLGFILIVFRLHISETFPSTLTNELNSADVSKSLPSHSIGTNITKFEKPEVRCCGCGCGCTGNCGCGCGSDSGGCCGSGGWGDGESTRSNIDGVYAYPVYVPVVYIVDNNVEAGSGVGYNALGGSTRYAGYEANGGYGSGYGGGCVCGYSGGAPRCDCGTYGAYGHNGNDCYGNCGYNNGVNSCGGFGKK